MDSKTLFINLHQILSTRQTMNARPTDYDRKLIVTPVYAAREGTTLSHLTTEFVGKVGKFYCAIVFDGSGDLGASLYSFAMPRVTRLNLASKALALQSVLAYLSTNGHLASHAFAYYREKIENEYAGGISLLADAFDILTHNSIDYIEKRAAGRTDYEFTSFWEKLPIEKLERIREINAAAYAQEKANSTK
ncbi:hypothetical protein [Burkholderia phage vB_BglM_WTB]